MQHDHSQWYSIHLPRYTCEVVAVLVALCLGLQTLTVDLVKADAEISFHALTTIKKNIFQVDGIGTFNHYNKHLLCLLFRASSTPWSIGWISVVVLGGRNNSFYTVTITHQISSFLMS